jgi:hypothetical protein
MAGDAELVLPVEERGAYCITYVECVTLEWLQV